MGDALKIVAGIILATVLTIVSTVAFRMTSTLINQGTTRATTPSQL